MSTIFKSTWNIYKGNNIYTLLGTFSNGLKFQTMIGGGGLSSHPNLFPIVEKNLRLDHGMKFSVGKYCFVSNLLNCDYRLRFDNHEIVFGEFNFIKY